jgi:hypothetical protein
MRHQNSPSSGLTSPDIEYEWWAVQMQNASLANEIQLTLETLPPGFTGAHVLAAAHAMNMPIDSCISALRGITPRSKPTEPNNKLSSIVTQLSTASTAEEILELLERLPSGLNRSDPALVQAMTDPSRKALANRLYSSITQTNNPQIKLSHLERLHLLDSKPGGISFISEFQNDFDNVVLSSQRNTPEATVRNPEVLAYMIASQRDISIQAAYWSVRNSTGLHWQNYNFGHPVQSIASNLQDLLDGGMPIEDAGTLAVNLNPFLFGIDAKTKLNALLGLKLDSNGIKGLLQDLQSIRDIAPVNSPPQSALGRVLSFIRPQHQSNALLAPNTYEENIYLDFLLTARSHGMQGAALRTWVQSLSSQFAELSERGTTKSGAPTIGYSVLLSTANALLKAGVSPSEIRATCAAMLEASKLRPDAGNLYALQSAAFDLIECANTGLLKPGTNVPSVGSYLVRSQQRAVNSSLRDGIVQRVALGVYNVDEALRAENTWSEKSSQVLEQLVSAFKDEFPSAQGDDKALRATLRDFIDCAMQSGQTLPAIESSFNLTLQDLHRNQQVSTVGLLSVYAELCSQVLLNGYTLQEMRDMINNPGLNRRVAQGLQAIFSMERASSAGTDRLKIPPASELNRMLVYLNQSIWGSGFFIGEVEGAVNNRIVRPLLRGQISVDDALRTEREIIENTTLRFRSQREKAERDLLTALQTAGGQSPNGGSYSNEVRLLVPRSGISADVDIRVTRGELPEGMRAGNGLRTDLRISKLDTTVMDGYLVAELSGDVDYRSGVQVQGADGRWRWLADHSGEMIAPGTSIRVPVLNCGWVTVRLP